MKSAKWYYRWSRGWHRDKESTYEVWCCGFSGIWHLSLWEVSCIIDLCRSVTVQEVRRLLRNGILRSSDGTAAIIHKGE